MAGEDVDRSLSGFGFGLPDPIERIPLKPAAPPEPESIELLRATSTDPLDDVYIELTRDT